MITAFDAPGVAFDDPDTPFDGEEEAVTRKRRPGSAVGGLEGIGTIRISRRDLRLLLAGVKDDDEALAIALLELL